MRVAFDIPGDIGWLVFAHRVPLAIAIAAIVVAPPFAVIVATREAIAFLFFLVGPSLHHVAELDHHVWSITLEITVELLCGDAIVEVVDDVFVSDVGDCGPCIEETLHMRPQTLVVLLFAYREVVLSSYPMQGALEVVDEYFLEVVPRMDGVGL